MLNSRTPALPKLFPCAKKTQKMVCIVSNFMRKSAHVRLLNKLFVLRTEYKQGEKSTKVSDSKLPSMKSALDVINRIEWDEQLPSENFLVGYLDSFLGTIERPFSSFDWSLDICDVETGKNPSAVPQHRIQYFKYKDAKVWDKELRLDLVFGSTGNEKRYTNLSPNWVS